ncbi:nuclear transport factor 2 family protein [Candidatus Parcubacteria bacterium]|nr:MAG: nuclear transport factor 2 family protein [Candidatus Parcubacteria bacterium]
MRTIILFSALTILAAAMLSCQNQATPSHVGTLRAAHEAFSAGDLDTAQKLVAADIKLTDHGRGQTFTNREAFRGWMEAFKTMSSDMKIVDAKYIDAGDWVTAQFRVVGTQDGPMDNFPASHKPFSLDVCEIWHFNANGEAIEGHNYSDGLGLLIQLGHIQPPQ